MCSAADPPRRARRPRRAHRAAAALRCVAMLALAGVAAGCTGSGSAPAKHPGTGLAGRRGVIARGGGGFIVARPGGGFIAVGGLSGRKGGRPQISVPRIPSAGSTQAITMPLDVYEQVADQEQDALSESQTLLVERCMSGRGFVYPAPASPSNGFVALQQIEDDPFGLSSMARAQSFGYAQPKGSNQQGPQIIGFVGGTLFAGALKNSGPAYTMALFGFGPGFGGGGRGRQEGCFQQATTEVYGQLGGNPDPDPVPTIAAQAAQWAQTDPRVLGVERAWSRCMAQHGYSYGTPLQAEQHNWPSTPTTVEVATAVADVSCKGKTNLSNTWLTVEAAYQQALIAENLSALSELQTNFASLLRRAEALLASGQPA